MVFENPSLHTITQPLLKISCSADSDNPVCFDANFIACDTVVTDSSCSYDTIAYIDWTCHTFKIPASKVGQTATLEIMAADCGEAGHFGYAYIDGICENCENNDLGDIAIDTSINFISCDSTVAKFTGSYTYPSACSDDWDLDTIMILGINVHNVEIDDLNQTFRFDVLKGSFGSDSCREICAKILFMDGTHGLPSQLSNILTICKSECTPSK